jgi:hypothetical protein
MTFTHSWVDPPEESQTGTSLLLIGTRGSLDLMSGAGTLRSPAREALSLHPGRIPDTRLALAAFVAAARLEEPPPPPITLAEAREATRIGLLVRRAVDEGQRRVVEIGEVDRDA